MGREYKGGAATDPSVRRGREENAKV